MQKHGINDEGKRQLAEKLYLQIRHETNLFLVTNPLVSGEREAAIESLFPAEVLAHEIDGKKFSLENLCPKSKLCVLCLLRRKLWAAYSALICGRDRGVCGEIDLYLWRSYAKMHILKNISQEVPP